MLNNFPQVPAGDSIGGVMPTPVSVVSHMVRTAWLRDGDLLYDLGCGNGNIVFEAAKHARVRAGYVPTTRQLHILRTSKGMCCGAVGLTGCLWLWCL